MEGPDFICEFFPRGNGSWVFDCTVKVRRSLTVSSIDYRIKPSRHRLESLSPVILWMMIFASISASGAGVVWGLKKVMQGPCSA